MGHYRYKKYRQKNKIHFLRSRFFWFGILFLLLLSSLFYFFIFSSVFQISTVQISGSKRIPAESIKNYLNSRLGKNIFSFQSKSIFLVNLKSLEKESLKEFPAISSIFLKRKLPDKVVVQITEREAIGNWCFQEEYYLIDKEGIAFEKGKDDKKLIITPEFNAISVNLGESVVDKGIVQGIIDINRELRDSSKLDIAAFSLAGENHKLTVKIKDGWEIYFDPQKKLQDQLFNLTLVLKEKIPQERLGDLEYIDLRFGSKVYFKYKGQPESVNLENKD